MKIFLLLISLVSFVLANVGVVVDVVGDSTLVRNGKNIKVKQKLELQERDLIKTSKNAKVKLFFKDDTAVSLGKNTTFEIDSYLFTGKPNSNIKFKVLKGFFKTVTGKISKVAPDKFKLKTKTATIGIRGTVFAADISDETDVVVCTDGKIILFTPSGDIEVPSGNMIKAPSTGGEPVVTQYSEAQKQALIENAGWHGSMTLLELIEYIKNNFSEPLRSQLLSTLQNILDKDGDERDQFNQSSTVNADDISFVDDITLNGRALDSFEQREIEFYKEDLDEGRVVVQGLLESEDKGTSVEELFVEISSDGGETWSRASGHGEWEWVFAPKVEYTYAFSLRVVKDVKGSSGVGMIYAAGEDAVNDFIADSIPDSLTIAGFTLNLNEDVRLSGGKITGSGSIEIPYLDEVTTLTTNEIDVSFADLSINAEIVTLGDITYEKAFKISTPIADVNIEKIVFSPTSSNHKIEGEIVYKAELATAFGTQRLPNTSKILPESFDIDIPFTGKTIDIWKEKDVKLVIGSGSLGLTYTLGDDLPKADFRIPSAQFELGELLKYANGVSAEIAMADFGAAPSFTLPNETFLLDTGMKLPTGMNVTFDLSDYTNPSISFSSSVNLSGYTNAMAQSLSNATIAATASKTGLSATLSADSALDPVTIIDRGSDAEDVRLVFLGDNPSISIAFTNEGSPSFELSDVTAELHFGDLLQDVDTRASGIVAAIGDIKAPTLNISNAIYLLGSKIKLPNGFNASVDLSNLSAPVIELSEIDIDFSSYENIVAKHISGAKINARLSIAEGFSASITSNAPSPITIYAEHDVKLNFLGDEGPSFGIDITSTESLPEFSISGINAELDFGTLIKKIEADGNNVIANVGVITKDDVEFLQLSLPAGIKLLDSNLALEGTYADLDLASEEITIESFVNFEAYANNPILNALSGSKFESTISTAGFSGTITVQDDLEPIDIWAEKDVSMSIIGRPMLGVYIDSNGVSFDFGALSASVNLGTLLVDAASAPVVATLSSALNEAGSYAVSISSKTYLLGSKFALDTVDIGFNPNVRSISLASAVDLSEYTNPLIKAFDGAAFSAAISTTGFSGSLSKEDGFEPIVILDRGEAKDVTFEFTESPTVSIDILASGVDFGFSGGSADLHFGDLLNDTTVALTSLSNGVYSWGMSEKTKLFSSGKAYVSGVENALLDIADFENPSITFNAKVDLSEYEGILASVGEASLVNAKISKNGFSASLSASIGTVNIWEEKNVNLAFNSNPTINLGLTLDGVSIGFSDLDAQIDFGDLLQDKDTLEAAVATLGNSLNPSTYTWSIEGSPIPLFGSEILLSTLGGSVDLSDFTNPSITLHAMADLSDYGSVFEYVTAAELKEVTISKFGFSGSLAAEIERIPVFSEKGVYINFLESPEFYLSINAGGLKVGASNLNAEVELGSLLNESKATLASLSDDVYSWNIEDLAGTAGHRVADTALYLKGLSGSINFANLKNPIINLNAVGDLDGYGDRFKGITLANATISKSGFSGDLSVAMDDITIYEEGDKKAELKFADGVSPTLSLVLTREEFSVGLSRLNADIAFTNVLNNQSITLAPYLYEGVSIEKKYSWELDGTHNFIDDSNGVIPITTLLGAIDLSDWQNPVVTFHTSADFTNYRLPGGINAGVAVVDAEIQKTKIDWNLAITGASAEYTILDLGEKVDDVRVELNDIDAQVGSGGTSVGAAAGTLFFGKLFDGAKSIEITYKNSSGLKTYGFSFDEEVVYRKDDNNFITFNNLNGDLIELSSGNYKVVLKGKAFAKSDILNAISIGELAITTLEIDSSKLRGDISITSNFSTTILTDKATLYVREVGIHIDSSKFNSMPITLTTFDGDLDLQAIFDKGDEDNLKVALEFASATASNPASVGWSFPNSKVLNINDNYLFKNLSGTLDLGSRDSLSIGLSGNFAYKGINKSITLDGFTINSSGVAGSISINEKINIVKDLDLTSLGVTFAGVDTSGSAKLAYSSTSFLSTGAPINLKLAATVDQTGIKSFALDTTGTNLTSINVAGFANFNFTGVKASPSMDNFWVSFDGTIKPTHTIFKSASPLEFKDFKVSSEGVSIGSAGADVKITGASGSIGALSMSITSLGMGIDESRFYVSAAGGIDIEVAEANASVTLYSDKELVINDIAVEIKQSGFEASGSLKWYRNDGIYGDGFKATLAMKIAEVFTADGELRIGRKGDIFYWFAAASGGPEAGIPFGSVTFYTVGGGIGYHMRYDDDAKDFVPHPTVSSLMLTTTLGTTADDGFLWHGDLKVIAGFKDTGGLDQVNMIGKSWVLSEKSETPSKREIGVEIEYAENTIHLKGSAKVEYKKIIVNGKIDVMFSPDEKHVFIGTDTEYGYAFNIANQLGHVSVSFLGIDASGFFMVDTNAIAFGQAIHINESWSKSWWGPDPSLALKLDASSKALIVYRPRFQMNLDVGVEVGLKACYGGCIDLGADVLLKLATPNPNYLYAKTRIYIFSTSIGYSGFIYGSGSLQAASEEVTPNVFDRVEPVNMDIGIMPIFKVYSSFSQGQPIDVRVHDVTLINRDDRSEVIRFDSNTTMVGDKKGASYIPTNVLRADTRYFLRGSMTATYTSDGKSETKTETFEKDFQTAKEDRVAFLDLVNNISPANNEQNVHEDKGVTVHYNEEVMRILGGTDNTYVSDYKINLYDADDNLIDGLFSAPEGSNDSSFKSTKALRVYIYCVNEAGVVRETFIQDGQYLNPFNGFIVDRGDTTMHSLNDGLNVSGTQALGSDMLYAQDSSLAIGDILAPNAQADTEEDSASGASTGYSTATVNQASRNLQVTLPTFLNIEPVQLKSPEALGELITVKRDRGASYSYYRASSYNIKVTYEPAGKEATLAYSSKFQVQFNNILAESKRKIETMKENLVPTLTVSLDENRIGASGIHVQKRGGNEFFNEVRTVSTTGLEEIGVYTGVKTKIIGSWTIRTEDGSTETVVQELQQGHNRFEYDLATFRLRGVLLEYSAEMQYISKIDDSLIDTVDMEMISGEPFSAAEEEEKRKENQDRMDGIADDVKQGSGRVGNLKGGGFGDKGGEFTGRTGGGFGHAGGGIGEAGDQYGEDMAGDMDAAGGDFSGGDFDAAGDFDAGFGVEVNGAGSAGPSVGASTGMAVVGTSGAAGAGAAAAGAARQGAGVKIIIDTGF